MRRVLPVLVAIGVIAAACADDPVDSISADSSPAPTEQEAIVETTHSTVETSAAPTTAAATTTPTTTTSTTTTLPPTTTTTIAVPDAVGPLDLSQPIVGLGFSVGGRPIFAERFGPPGGRRVLVIGVIHGNEDDGLAIVDELRRRTVPDDVELWVVESMNPDGVAAQDRHNANEVDLNRNFPFRWGPIGQPGDGQYAGPGPASEPETQAIINLMQQLQPDITIWYHQDLFVVNPAQGREGRIRARYADLTGLPMGEITGGIYTGIAATWARNEFSDRDGVAFIVELGPTLSPAEASTHADAVLTVAVEG